MTTTKTKATKAKAAPKPKAKALPEPVFDNIASLAPAHDEIVRMIRFAYILVEEATDLHNIKHHVTGERVLEDKRRVVPTIQTKGKRSRCYAWFSDPQAGQPHGWESREGESLQEMAFSAEDLHCPGVEMTTRAIHEVVHKWCKALGVKDTALSGRHNMDYAKYARYLGLDVAPATDSYGHGYTSASKELAERIEKEFQPDITKLDYKRTTRAGRSKAKKERRFICSEECAPVYIKTDKKVFGGKCHQCGRNYREA
ncbi:hypothetical protein CMI37_29420 [Candidatus Pacearchaeota archaeon]|nr:hypothetical protein [Candidatus Pacearchaeota archaeon]|tara:strand:+ start:247 stop:1014 length:768 start_codon:yes stop_codon:yes gene_type:complete